MTPQRVGAIAAAVSLAADQVVKNFLLYGWDFLHYAPGQRVQVLPFFDLVMVWNRGVSYGLFQAGDWKGTAVLSALAIVLIGALTWWLTRAERRGGGGLGGAGDGNRRAGQRHCVVYPA
jgi:signal peptidase II